MPWAMKTIQGASQVFMNNLQSEGGGAWNNPESININLLVQDYKESYQKSFQ